VPRRNRDLQVVLVVLGSLVAEMAGSLIAKTTGAHSAITVCIVISSAAATLLLVWTSAAQDRAKANSPIGSTRSRSSWTAWR
jgi:hypothetical protein